MTAIQLQYQQLQEQKRANLEQESIKSREARSKEREVAIRETKLPQELENLIAEGNLTRQQETNLRETVAKIRVEAENISANTQLTNAQKYVEYSKLAQNAMNLIHRITGLPFFGDQLDWVKDVVGDFLGGFGKTAGKALIG